jgi:hypothetical protein
VKHGNPTNLIEYVWGVLIGIDMLTNALIAGAPGETLSSRAGYARFRGKTWGRAAAPAIDVFILIVSAGRARNHCAVNVQLHFHPDYVLAEALSLEATDGPGTPATPAA